MMPGNKNLETLTRSGIRVFTNLAKATPDCRMLTIGEPDLPTPEPIKLAAMKALEENQTHYAPNQGTLPLRTAIAAFETARGRTTAPEEVLVTVGATQAIYTALTGILNPGDQVIIPTPAFSLYDTITTAAGAESVFLDVSKTDFQITPQGLADCLTEKTRAIVLNSPCNPTGVILNRESLDAVKEVLKDRDMYLICDNVYNQLVYGQCEDLSLDEELKDKTILCQSFSKPYAMTGWRMGYLLSDASVKERLELVHQFMVVSTPAPFQSACMQALECDISPMLETYRTRRDYVLRRLGQMHLPVHVPEGAFYVFPSIREFGLSSAEFCRRMIREAGLAATPGSCFGAEGYIRLTYCYSGEELRQGLDRLEQFVRVLRGKGDLQ